MLNLIAYNLIPVPKLVPAYARPAKLPRTIDRITRATPTREKPMLFPANFNFKAAVVDVAKLVDHHSVHPVELTGVAASAAESGFFSRPLDKLMDCRRATNATAHVLATERKAADCILVMEVAGARYLPSQVHTKDRI
jgi:hypothetical protein